MITLRDETPSDRGGIRKVTIDAFANSEFGHNGEADLIDAVRAATDQTLSLVAIHGTQVVGHILFSPVSIECAHRTIHGIGLGPLSVLPAFQRKGIGSQLVEAGLRRLVSRNTPFSVVAGHPGFYTRFGFVPSADYGITHGFAGMPQEVFFIRADSMQSLQDLRGGLAFYLPAFGAQHNTVVEQCVEPEQRSTQVFEIERGSSPSSDGGRAHPEMNEEQHANTERNLGEQPIARLMAAGNLTRHDLVAASTQQITHKMVARACKGRWLTPNTKNKVLDALNKAAGKTYAMRDVFNY